MKAIESLAPGFRSSLQSMDGASATRATLAEYVDRDRFLSASSKALVGVAVAYRLGGPYSRWVMERAASAAGA